MADLSTTYMGIKLSSPVVVGASTFSNRVDNIKKAEELGAGALVIYSLFQEQIELEALEVQDELMIGSEQFAESLTYFPKIDHAGSREHIMWTERTRSQVRFPLIGSLNAVSRGNWIDYAKQLEGAGCDALELNLYAVETNPAASAAEVEQRSLDTIAAVKSAVSIPVSVKLSPFYSSLAHFAARAVEAGADGLVLFNRFYQPTIDVENEKLALKLELSASEDQLLPLRWVAILSGALKADFAASSGVDSGADTARQILAGARAVQTVSALYRNGLEHIATMNSELSAWMDAKGYSGIEDFRGKLNQASVSDPFAFERAQYVRLLTGAHEQQKRFGLVHGYYPVEVRVG